VTVRILDVSRQLVPTRARMPFRFGMAEMTELPHVILQVELEVDGRAERGLAADGLAPKWFTKDRDTSVEEDRRRLLEVIDQACEIALRVKSAPTVFAFWRELFDEQLRVGEAAGHPPLPAGLGASLVERAVIDAYCRATSTTFSRALRDGGLGLRLGDLHSELRDREPRELLPRHPRDSIRIRHTVGLSDPLTDSEVSADEGMDDGLPRSLEACIGAYGLTHFKLKLFGDAKDDLERLRAIVGVLEARAPSFVFTLDGNERFPALADFREFWAALQAERRLTPAFERLLFVEQPVRREGALSVEAKRTLTQWREGPPLVVDESDETVESVSRALACGYSGTSYKNCKGVFKGVANACLIQHRRESDRTTRLIVSAEDLSNIGPIALLQDSAAVAALGIAHAERNGHHYFTGLSMFSADIQELALRHHGDLYHRHQRGFATLAIEQGDISLVSVNRAPFGYEPALAEHLLGA
jgi:hypothetical protein